MKVEPVEVGKGSPTCVSDRPGDRLSRETRFRRWSQTIAADFWTKLGLVSGKVFHHTSKTVFGRDRLLAGTSSLELSKSDLSEEMTRDKTTRTAV